MRAVGFVLEKILHRSRHCLHIGAVGNHPVGITISHYHNLDPVAFGMTVQQMHFSVLGKIGRSIDIERQLIAITLWENITYDPDIRPLLRAIQ